MSFELRVVSATPLSSVDALDEAVSAFLTQIGYLQRSGTDASSIPYRLAAECFFGRPDKPWVVGDLATYLGTSKPTVYRHINKLKALDLLDEVSGEETGGKKAYRLRYGDLSKAWNFAEAHVDVAMENYRKSVDHIQALLEKQRKN